MSYPTLRSYNFRVILLGFLLNINPDSLAATITRAESFVLARLGDSLRLPVLRSVSEDSFLLMGSLDTTDFGTSFFLNAARFSSSPDFREASARAAGLLYARRLPGDLFKYYPLRRSCDPDADDIACISYELALAGYNLTNLNALLALRDSSGGFRTWITKRPVRNDVDAEVNSNIARWLFRLGYRDEGFLRFLNAQVRNPELHYSWSPLAFCYTMSRLIRDEPDAIPDSLRASWSRSLVERALAARPWSNLLNLALAANTLMNLGYEGAEVDEAVSALISSQEEDGSWPGFAFYIKRGGPEAYCFGSRELTTVIVLEALYRYNPR